MRHVAYLKSVNQWHYCVGSTWSLIWADLKDYCLGIAKSQKKIGIFFGLVNRCKIIFWRNIFLLNILMVKIFQILILTHWLAQIVILVHWFWISIDFRTLPDRSNIRTRSAVRFNLAENKQIPSILEKYGSLVQHHRTDDNNVTKIK